jgi:phosphatidylinositol 3-kinase
VWRDDLEAKQAIELLKVWTPIDIEDALELLGKQFKHAEVRKYAISRLRNAEDEVHLFHSSC